MKSELEIKKEIFELKGLLHSISKDKYMKQDEYMQSVAKQRYENRLETLEWVLGNGKYRY